MSDWAGKRERPLIAVAMAVLGVVLAAELYHQLGARPALPILLFELLEVVLLVGCTVSSTLLILRVRVRAMAAATAAMLAVLLVGELFLGDRPALPTLLVELLEVILVVGGSIACVLLVRRGSWHEPERGARRHW
jgi:hypothetical protein